MLVGTFQETLKCLLSEEEVRQRASKLAIVQKQIEEEEEEKKDAASSYANEIKRLSLKRQMLAQEVRDQATFRQVDCKEQLNEATGEVETVRLDTGEVLRSRVATGEERQRSFLSDE